MSEERKAAQNALGQDIDLKQLTDRLRGVSPADLAQARGAGQGLAEQGVSKPMSVDLRTETFSPKPTPPVLKQDDSAARGKKIENEGSTVQHSAAGYDKKTAEQSSGKEAAESKRKEVNTAEKVAEVKAESKSTSTPAELTPQLQSHAKQADVSRRELGNTKPGQTPAVKGQEKGKSPPTKGGPTRDGPSR